jgi:hypothetical protein
MATLIHPNSSTPLIQNNVFSLPTAVCNYGNPTQNETGPSEIDPAVLEVCVQRYMDFMGTKLNAQEQQKMVYYSSFKVSDILLMISQNLECGFLRAYTGMDENGNQFKVLMPVKPDNTGKVKTASDAVYVSDCCHCQPDCGNGSGF